MPSLALLQRDHEASPHLKTYIERTGRFEVVGLWHTVAEARHQLAQQHPDLLMADLRVQDGDVVPLLRDLRRPVRPSRPARPHVLVTTVAQDDALLMGALRAGADGYWVHAGAPDLLIATLDQLARGESPMTPTIARHVLGHFDRREPSDAGGLTGDERQLLQQVAQGYLIDEIAAQWHDSVHSVACGIRRVYHKLQFDRHELGLSPA